MTEPMRRAIESLVGDSVPIDLLACYEGTVVAQRADGTFDVKVDDIRFGEGLPGVPYRKGVPGLTVTVPKGARCVVGFENLRRDCPVVKMFAEGTPISVTIETSDSVTIKATNTAIVDASKIELGVGATLGVARLTDTVQAGPYAGNITGASGSVTAKS